MPLTATSTYGHKATFHSPTATQADLADVTWTKDSIHIPSCSALNAPADVWFNIPTSLKCAKSWCRFQKVAFLGLWHENRTGFGFHAQGFSRYKYVDSDDETPPRRGVKAEIDDDDIPPPPNPLKQTFDIPKGQDDDAIYRLRSALFDHKGDDDVRMRDSEDEETVPDEQRGEVFLDFGDDLSDDEKPIPPAMPIHELPYPIYEDSVAGMKEGVFSDTGLMLGRSTRPSFVNGVMANARYHSRAATITTGFGVMLSGIYGELSSSVADLLRIHCATWFLTREEKDRICLPSLTDAFQESAVADRTVELFVDELWKAVQAGDDDSRHARVVFWLILALYKGGDAVEVEEDCLIRRLAEWADGDAGTLFDERPVASGLRKSLLQLCIGHVEEAVESAVDAGFVRLAMLISRALENPKDDLRLDAESQLAVYGLVDIDELEDPDGDPERWDKILADTTAYSTVTIDERMILLVLAGHVAPVARFMNFSWYRLFILELLYGAGSSELTQPERVASAVQAVEKGRIETTAPHAATKDIDVAYHLLRLYADPTTKYPLTSGVYSCSSFGVRYRPLDSRFSWLLHQVLSSLIPEAGLKDANVLLSDAFAAQLRAGGMPLWAFYVLCCGRVSRDVLKETVIRDWPQMAEDSVKVTEGVLEAVEGDNDKTKEDERMRENGTEGEGEKETGTGKITAEKFLTKVLRVPQEWIYEAKAISASLSGDKLEECCCWILSRSEEGAARAHEILSQELVPEIIVAQDTKQYVVITNLLKDLAGLTHVPNWHSCGDLQLSYLERIVGVPDVRQSDLQELRSLVARLPSFAERAKSWVQRHAAAVMADGIATAQRAKLLSITEGRDVVIQQLRDDLAKLPCTPSVRQRLEGEYEIESAHPAIAARYAGALPHYTKFVLSNS